MSSSIISFSLSEKVNSRWGKKRVWRESRTARRQRAGFVLLPHNCLTLLCSVLPSIYSTSGSDFSLLNSPLNPLSTINYQYSKNTCQNLMMKQNYIAYLYYHLRWAALKAPVTIRSVTHTCADIYIQQADCFTPLPQLSGDTAPPAVGLAAVCMCSMMMYTIMFCADESKQIAISSVGFQSNFQRTWFHTFLCWFWQADDWWTRRSSESRVIRYAHWSFHCRSYIPTHIFLFLLTQSAFMFIKCAAVEQIPQSVFFNLFYFVHL